MDRGHDDSSRSSIRKPTRVLLLLTWLPKLGGAAFNLGGLMSDVPVTVLLRALTEANKLISDTSLRGRSGSLLAGLKQDGLRGSGISRCNYPGCELDAIDKSHTVQRASMERAFGKDCVTPTWQHDHFALKESSIKSVSTFPGYCGAHEKIFKFEDRGCFLSENDDLLQMMRTVHRELWLTNRRIEFLNKIRFAIKVTGDALRVENKADCPETRNILLQSGQIEHFLMTQRSMQVRLKALSDELGNSASTATSVPPGRLRGSSIPPQQFAFHAAVMLDGEWNALLAICVVFSGSTSRLITAIEPDFEFLHEPYWNSHLSADTLNDTLTAWLRDGTLDWYASPEWWASLSSPTRLGIEQAVNRGF